MVRRPAVPHELWSTAALGSVPTVTQPSSMPYGLPALDDRAGQVYSAGMNYVPRRILITKPDGKQEEVAEPEFASIAGPRILLGEPGAGKSDTAHEIMRLDQGVEVHAELLASGAPAGDLTTRTVIIDGVDEVLVNGTTEPITAILNRLVEVGAGSFVLMCRALDWKHATSENAIERRFRVRPVVGHLQPLDHREMADIVEVFSKGGLEGAKFVQDAIDHGAIELARNPQNLLLLIEAVAEGGWPNTRRELYENASMRLTRELNPSHQSLRPDRPDGERILQAAGFVSAQLLLSGKRGVATGGQHDPLYPRIADVEGGGFTSADVAAAMGSALMRVSSVQTLEVCHRTVAEYLGARWLAGRLNNDVSPRRLESILYAAGTTIVPGSLRGLHAWLAVLDVGHARRFIEADPYGVLRYGDTGSLADDQIQHLLRALPVQAKGDPLFRSEDWDLEIGKSLARESLKEDIVALMADKDASYQLTTVILESVKGTPLAGQIRGNLQELALDSAETYVERLRAAEAACDGVDDDTYRALVTALLAMKDTSSTRLAIEIMDDRPKAFSGSDIADAMVAYYRPKGRNIVGIGYRLVCEMETDQLKAFLNRLAPHLPTNIHADTEFAREVETMMLDAVQAILNSGADVEPQELLRWTARTSSRSYARTEWNKLSEVYFAARPELRRDIQSLAFKNAKTVGDFGSVGFNLNRIAQGLTLQSDDLIYHMERLRGAKRKTKDWEDRWFHLFRWADMSKFDEATSHGREMALGTPALQAVLDEYDNLPEPEWQREHREYERKRVARDKAEKTLRWEQFTKARDQIADGTNLQGLDTVAHIYFGWYTNLDREATPAERLAEETGPGNAEYALQGLRAFRSRNDLPTVRQASELQARESKRYFATYVAIASCALQKAEGGRLDALPMQVLELALCGLDWGVHHSGDKLDSLARDITALVMDTPERMERFVRDNLEPFLEEKKSSITGMNTVLRGEQYQELSSRLSVEWLQRFPDLPAETFGYLIDAAVAYGDRVQVTQLVRNLITNNAWQSDEHRANAMGAAFILDFAEFRAEVSAFAAENKGRLWTFRRADHRESYEAPVDPVADIARLVFLLETFAPNFPHVEMPSAGWGGNSDYEGAQFIASLIKRLGSIPSTEARAALLKLIGDGHLGNHLQDAQHVAALQERAIAEVSWGSRTFQDVRSILQGGAPGTIDDLQAFVMDELHMLQRELQDGLTEGVEPYWNDTIPHTENYCRNRVIEGLQYRLLQRGVRVTPEGAMPDNTRCDILCWAGQMSLPVEIKGQWNPEVWTAASHQLEDNYARHYACEGRGIYLVLWFGNVPRHNPPRLSGQKAPETAAELLEMLPVVSPRAIDGKTHLMVLDVIRPPKKQEKIEAKAAEKLQAQAEKRPRKSRKKSTK